MMHGNVTRWNEVTRASNDPLIHSGLSQCQKSYVTRIIARAHVGFPGFRARNPLITRNAKIFNMLAIRNVHRR